MKTCTFLSGAIASVLLVLGFVVFAPVASGSDCPVAGDPAVAAALVKIRDAAHLPAMAGAIATSRGIDRFAVVGVRKTGTDVPVALDDKWHLGSCTKAMTAALAARLVEQGLLKWETTVAESFPDLAPDFHPDFRRVNLLQLLSHRAGLPKDTYWGAVAIRGTVPQQRLLVVRQSLSQKPKSAPGEKFEYSNLGYVIAGAMIEKAAGKNWEDTAQERIFQPLDMKTVGYGGAGSVFKLDQPRGHHSIFGVALAMDAHADNPAVMSAAGRVHCSIEDWAKFAADQLRGVRGEKALLKPESYAKMHEPPFGGDYALGWGIVERPWGDGTVWNHCGSNTMHYSDIWVAPKRDFAVLVCTNQGGDDAAKACDQAASALIRLHQGKQRKGTVDERR